MVECENGRSDLVIPQRLSFASSRDSTPCCSAEAWESAWNNDQSQRRYLAYLDHNSCAASASRWADCGVGNSIHQLSISTSLLGRTFQTRMVDVIALCLAEVLYNLVPSMSPLNNNNLGIEIERRKKIGNYGVLRTGTWYLQ